MELGTFYALFSATCFTLVGLWWNVIERRPDWSRNPAHRRMAGGIYLSFLLPGLMGLLAQVSPLTPWMWRGTFAVVAAVGCWATVRLVRADVTASLAGPFSRNRWILLVAYGLIVVLAVFPDSVGRMGLTPLQVAAILLIVIVLIGHGLTWEFMARPDAEQDQDPAGPMVEEVQSGAPTKQFKSVTPSHIGVHRRSSAD